MRTDELRHALDDLAGPDPSVDAGLDRVTRRVRAQRARRWGAVATACVLVIAVASVGAVQLRENDHEITVKNPTPSPRGSVEGFAWTRVAAPDMTINRIVSADGKTLALGSSPDGTAAIGTLDANGALEKIVNPTVDPSEDSLLPPPPATVNDLVAFRSALIAVGRTTPGNESFGAVWRSTDDGRTWHGAAVETSTDGPLPSVDRIVVSNGVVYALGTQPDTTSSTHCVSNVWTSTDGTDFRLLGLPSNMACAGPEDAVDGPSGLLITTPGSAPPFANSIAWTRSGGKWTRHRIPTNAAEPNAGIGAVAGDADSYVAVGSFATASDSAAAIWWSPDGDVWKHVVTARGAADPHGSWAVFTGVAHTSAGWIAVGARGRRDNTTGISDAMVWTSSDGVHWTESTRDGTTFEQFARANGVGATADGFAILGPGNISVRKDSDAFVEQNMLWLGSSTPSSSAGIVEGTMHEVGGRSPGLPEPVPGTLVATGADHEQHTTAIDANGRFSIDLPAGDFTLVGHSPMYGSGKYDCGANTTPVVVRANRVTHVELSCQIR